MSTALKCQIKSTSSATTEKLAAQIGTKLQGDEVIELISDLGGGKTVFVKGLVKGTGSQEQVTSPTFTISRIYRCPAFDVAHYDFYRLNNPGVVSLELEESVADPKTVAVIEWADIVKGVLPKDKLQITIKNEGGDRRLINITCPKNRTYLLEGLKC